MSISEYRRAAVSHFQNTGQPTIEASSAEGYVHIYNNKETPTARYNNKVEPMEGTLKEKKSSEETLDNRELFL